MNFVSTRNSDNKATFTKAVLNPMAQDGGLFVPDECEDLRRWILYADENTSFASLAGSLTSAMINKEYSPIICETIASKAFKTDPVLKQLDDKLFILELYHGPTGTFKDFGVSYLTSALETIAQYNGEKAILLDVTTGELGACMANAIRDKKHIKSVLVAPKGKFRGLTEEDFVWNGGNIFPVEVEGTEQDCRNLVRKIFSQKSLVEKYNLTVANTANIGRLLPQSFFYTYAFAHLRKIVSGDIYYALSAGNYGNLVSGLYAWKLSLPVNGFIVPATPNLQCNAKGQCMVLDSVVPVEKRTVCDPCDPSNIERLEQIFKANALMLHSFVFPSTVTRALKEEACKELFVKYHIYADSDTSSAYAASLLQKKLITQDDGTVVLIARDSPCLDSDFICHNIGEKPEVTANVKNAFSPVELYRKSISPDDTEALISVLNSINLLRIF